MRTSKYSQLRMAIAHGPRSRGGDRLRVDQAQYPGGVGLRSSPRLQGEGVQLVVADPRSGVGVPGAPIEDTLHDGWTVEDRAPAGEAPQDPAGRRIECIHESRFG